MRSTRMRGALALVAGAIALTAAACGSSNNGGSSGGGASSSKQSSGPVTLTWWHNGTADPLKGVWSSVARSYHQAHPNVSIKVQPIQNEQFTTKVPVALQSSNPPEIYQQWGGGQEATQIRSGKVMDLTQLTSTWIKQIGGAAAGWQVDGKQYGVPFSLHIVGFWYRKDLFKKAGIAAPPTTLDELNADVAKLKKANIAPIAIGSKDRWPDAFWWEYFALRECPTDVLKQSMKDQSLTDPCFTKAGDDTKAFMATKPFQSGFLGTPAQQGAGSSAGMVANGKAAMELQGDWDPPTMAPLTKDKNLNAKLGWFPFPTVPGGKGDPTTTLGGGDGFSCTTKASPACADFLKYIDSPPVQKQLVSSGAASLPVNPAAASAISIPAVKDVLAYSQKASYIQTYFDIALPTAPGQALDDAVANFFAGKGSSDAIPKSVTQ
jgi:raffinose/stachyose/melibiose transport system substrate-binding protein